MTAPYARLSDKTVREHREKARKVNAEGQPVQISPDGPLSDAARAKRQLSCARSITPSGGPPSRSSPRPGRKGVKNRQVAVDLDKIITALEADGRRQPPMRPDPPGHPAKAAARRHELTRAKAIQALHELDRAGASHLRIRRRSSRDIPVLALYQADIHS